MRDNEFSGSISSFLHGAILRHPSKFVLFVLSSTLFALSEGFSVTLVVPILDASGAGSLANMPIVSGLLQPLNGIPPSPRLAIIAVLLAVSVLIRGAMQFASNYLSSTIYVRLQSDYLKLGYGYLVHANLWSMITADTGDIQTVLREHTQRMGAVVQSLCQVIMAVVLVALFGGLMLLISWQMTAASTAFICVTYLLLKKLSEPWFYWAGERLSVAIQKVQRTIYETVSVITLVRLRSSEDLMKSRFNTAVEELYSADAKRLKYMNIQGPAIMTFSGLFIAALLLLVSLLYPESREVWAPTFIYFVLCLSRLIGPGSQLVTAQGSISGNTHAISEFQKFTVEARSSRLSEGDEVYRGFVDKISFDNVSLAYNPQQGPAVADLTFTIRKNSTTALIGASGAGKSTVLTLLMRMRDPDSGAILIDGIDLKDLKMNSWQRNIAVVSQNLVFFNDSIRNNLTFGLSDVTESQIRHALEIARADQFVALLPEGIDTAIGEGGRSLSGGERQRLAIARAVISDPEILILDEATSQLDTVTEKSIQDMIDQLGGRKTIVIVAHRLSTIRYADCIYVLNQGRIIAEGRHEDLFEANPIYQKMFETQRIGTL